MTFLTVLHALLSYLGFFATMFWAGAIWIGAGDVNRFGKLYRASYIAALSTVGMAGIFGLIITLAGPFMTMIFPWLGLVVVALHGILGKRAKTALMAMQTGKSLKLAAVQVILLIIATGLMSAKPF